MLSEKSRKKNRRGRRRGDEEEEEEEEEESEKGSVFSLFVFFGFKIRNREISWEKWGTLGKWGR